MKYVFCDTMVYLHYQDITGIDFHSFFGKAPITIMVPEIVIHEIDKHKDNHQIKKIRDRAKKISHRFYEYVIKPANSETEIKTNLKIKFLPHDIINYEEFKLDPQKQDHALIGAILKFKKNISNDDSVVFITHDNGATATAKHRGVELFRLPDELQLADPLDESEKEIRDLRTEVLSLKNAQPKLKIYAKDQKGVSGIQLECLKFKIPKATTSLEEEKAKFPERKRTIKEQGKGTPREEEKGEFSENKEHKKAFYQSNRALAAFQDTWISGLKANVEELDRYERDRESYFQRYEDYLQQLAIRSKKCLAWINLVIENTGTAPAEGVDIYIHFPDGFEIYLEENIPVAPEKPRNPVPPRSQSQIFDEQIARASNIGYPKLIEPEFMHGMSSFSLKKTNSYEFEDTIDCIKHGKHAAYEIVPLLIVFKDKESVKNFAARYRLSANNIQSAIEGDLHFKFSDFKKD